MKPLTEVVGQAPGNVIALIQHAKVVDSAHFRDGEAGPAPDQVVAKSPRVRHGTEGVSGPSNSPDSASTGWRAAPGDGDEILVTAVIAAARQTSGRAADRRSSRA